MNLWTQLNDFSDFNKKIPCPLCKGESESTLVGNHFKCSVEGHVFNEDGSETGLECWCDSCRSKETLNIPMSKDLETKVAKKRKSKK